MTRPSPATAPERGIHAFFIVVLMVAATALFIGANSRAINDHVATERAILDLQAQEQALSRDVLRLRDGLLRNYDSTVEGRNRIAALIAEVGGGRVAFGDGATTSRPLLPEVDRSALDPQFAMRLSAYADAVAASAATLERFQARNAVLQNSLAFSAALAKDLMTVSFREPGGLELARATERALNDMFEFFVTNSDAVAGPRGHAAVLRTLATNHPPPVRAGVDSFITHLEIVFSHKAEVDRLVNDYLARPEPELLEELFDITRANLHAAQNAARAKITALYAVSVVLVAYVAFIILRLLQARFRLSEANTSLEQRVQERTAGLEAEIAERTRTEAALRRSETRLAGILDIAPDAMILIDRDCTIRLYNQGAEAVFGHTAEQAIGQSMEILVAEHFRPNYRAMVAEFSASPAAVSRAKTSNQITGVRKDGTEFPTAVSISKMESAGEAALFFVMRDVSERVEAENAVLAAKEHAELANRTKSQFLANMSHELRTPLNAIIGFAEVIENQTFGTVGNPRYLEYIADIRESGEHLLALINDILDLSKIEAGKSELYEERLDVPGLVGACMLVVRARAETAGVTMRVEIPGDLPYLFADERKIKQILINLLSNAVKFTDSGGRVTAAAWADADGLHLRITDTGIGIAAADIPRALASFQQIESDLNRNFDGTGLGLPLTKSLIELHGGAMDLQSEPGVGTAVTATFPADRVVPRRRRAEAAG